MQASAFLTLRSAHGGRSSRPAIALSSAYSRASCASVSVTGLTEGTTYHFAVYEYNGSGSGKQRYVVYYDAPSPTGALHLGNARTFLLNWLLARQLQWRIMLRIEDLDGPRIKRGADQTAIDDFIDHMERVIAATEGAAAGLAPRAHR